MHPRPTVSRMLAPLFALALLMLGWASTAQAQAFPPRPDGPVYDGAGLLSPATVAALDQRLKDYNRETGNAIIVATIPSLGGQPIEPYATALFAEWGIGGEKRDTGLLLLIARDDRKMRIEIGYGLHPWFGGIMAGRVIRERITPAFKQGDFDAGVIQGVDAILNHLAKSPQDAIAIEEAAKAAEQTRTRSDGGFPFGMLIWMLILFAFFVWPLIRASRKSRKYRAKGKGPWGKRRRDDDDDDDHDGWGRTARDIILWEVGSAIVRGALNEGGRGGSSWGGGGFGGGGGGGGGFGGFGGGMSGGGGASGGW